MSDINTYASWGQYSASYKPDTKTFVIRCKGKDNAVQNARIESIIYDGENMGGTDIFEKCEFDGNRCKEKDSVFFSVKFSKGPVVLRTLKIKFILSDNGVKIVVSAPEKCVVKFSGDVWWGDGSCENTYPMSSKKDSSLIQTAVGPAASLKDDMLFDRLSDSAIVFKGGKSFRIKYDWEKKCYTFAFTTGATRSEKTMYISVKENLLTEQFHIKYAPINKNRTFKNPPVGWMTWYAVKFDACEEKVLKNAKWMSENLKEYGANCIWVDWEWNHKDMSGARSDGADSFNPDKEKYPHGLKYVSDEIKRMGLIPALWIGFTVDPAMNEYTQENPEIILVDEPWWCGRYFFDISHPKYLNEFLPKALANVAKWGYDAVKYDTLPASMIIHEKHHSKMYNPQLTTQEAYRAMIEKTRSILGEDCYMLSCAGDNDADVLWAADIFDSARVGGDIFKWEEFLHQGVGRTLRFYPLHNNVFYPDGDNVVLREEFNNIHQAASRMYFVAMLGLPVTFGDEFDALDADRINLIKQSLPVLDIHPKDIYRQTKVDNILKMNLSIEKEWENYNVLNIFNTTMGKASVVVDLQNDLGLDNAKYIVYDYTADRLVGIKSNSFSVELDSCESRIFSIRRKLERPQIISTSRHISQGAAEITDMFWSEETAKLEIDAELIGNAEYCVALYVPDGYAPVSELEYVCKNVYKKVFVPRKSGIEHLEFKFKH